MARAVATPTEPTGFIKARDVRFQLQGESVSPKVQHILEALAEQAAHQEKKMTSMAQMIEQMADIIGSFVNVAQNMKDTIQRMGEEQAHPELGPLSTGEVN